MAKENFKHCVRCWAIAFTLSNSIQKKDMINSVKFNRFDSFTVEATSNILITHLWNRTPSYIDMPLCNSMV